MTGNTGPHTNLTDVCKVRVYFGLCQFCKEYTKCGNLALLPSSVTCFGSSRPSQSVTKRRCMSNRPVPQVNEHTWNTEKSILSKTEQWRVLCSVCSEYIGHNKNGTKKSFRCPTREDL